MEETAKKVFEIRTRWNSTPHGKPRVYFCCHPKDFENNFDKICEDIFKTHDCAIYYTADMAAPIPEDDEKNTEIDLMQMNLFVVPVTFKLMIEPNRAMNFDLEFAKKHNKPILPIMIESGIDTFYALEKNFGERQYLNPYSGDITEISYEEKLKKYLESVLIGEETAKRIRKAFDAYIFLSYRKKDRRYANELMKKIHSDPAYRDIAIWYDEFLTPGESFKENIEKALKDSRMLALLVTPNIVNEDNYIRTTEYPMATEKHKTVLPAEAVPTDRAELEKQYPGIAPCVKPEDEAEFKKRFAAALDLAAKTENDSDPEHNYLIGLAYLDGIDVETDIERGLALVTSAAESDYDEAMEMIYEMYRDGKNVKIDYQNSLLWIKKIYKSCLGKYGKTHRITLTAQIDLAAGYAYLSQYGKAIETGEGTYKLCAEVFGEKHPNTLTELNNLAYYYSCICNFRKALELSRKSYELHRAVFGEKHLNTLTTFSNLGVNYANAGKKKKALEISREAYRLSAEILGDSHPQTLTALTNLAACYSKTGNYAKSFELSDKAIDLCVKTFGENYPITIMLYNNLSVNYYNAGNRKKAIELQEKAHRLFSELLGEKHIYTLTALAILATYYYKTGNYSESLELSDKAMDMCEEVLGRNHVISRSASGIWLLSEIHWIIRYVKKKIKFSIKKIPLFFSQKDKYEKAIERHKAEYDFSVETYGEKSHNTFTALNNLAHCYRDIGDYTKAIELYEKAYNFYAEVLGERHLYAITSLSNLASYYRDIGDYTKSLELCEKAYNLYVEVLGEKHPNTLTSLSNLAIRYSDVGNYIKAIELGEKVYMLRAEVLGEKHPDTLTSLHNLAIDYSNIYDYTKAIELAEKAYKLRVEVLGEKHPDTIDLLKHLAGYYSDTDDYAKALERAEKAYNGFKEIYGEEDKKTLSLLCMIENIKDCL